MATFQEGGEQRVDEFATGTSGFGGAEGTFRDAEDGKLGMNPIAQGAVDSTMGCVVHVGPREVKTLYMILMAGNSREELQALQLWLDKQTPKRVIDGPRATGACGPAARPSTSATCPRAARRCSSGRS